MIYLSYCLLICVVSVLRVSSTTEGSGSNEDEAALYIKEQDRQNSELSPTTPPEIIYWASWKKNITVYDKNGMAWYCYTYRQSHCSPLSPIAKASNSINRQKSTSGKGKVFLDGEYNQVNGTVINIDSKMNLKGGNYYPLFPEHDISGEGRHPTSSVDFRGITKVSSDKMTTQAPSNFYYDPKTSAPISLTTYTSDQSRGNTNQNYPQTQSPFYGNTQFPEQYPISSTNTFTPVRPVPRGIPFPNVGRRTPLGDGYYYNNDGEVRNRSTVPTIWRIIKTVTRHRPTTVPTSVFFVNEKHNTVTPSSTYSQAHSGINLSILGDKSLSTTGVTLSPPNPTTHKAYPSSEFDENWQSQDTSNTLIWSNSRDLDTNNGRFNKDPNTHSESNDRKKDTKTILTTGSKDFSELSPLTPENDYTTESYDPFEWNQSTPDESVFGARLSPPTVRYISTTTTSPQYDDGNLSLFPPEKEFSSQMENKNKNNNPNIGSNRPEYQGNPRGFDTGFTFNEQKNAQANKEGDFSSQGTTPNSLFSQVTFKWKDEINKEDSETVIDPKVPVFDPKEQTETDSTTPVAFSDEFPSSEEEGNNKNDLNIPIFVNNGDDQIIESSTKRLDEKILLVDGISVNQGTTTVSYTFTESKTTPGKKEPVGKFDGQKQYENSRDSISTDKPIRDDIDFGSISEETFIRNTPTPTSEQNAEEIGFTKNTADPLSRTTERTFDSNSKDRTASKEGELETNSEGRNNQNNAFDEILTAITSTTFSPLPFDDTTEFVPIEKDRDTSSTNFQNEVGNKTFISNPTEKNSATVPIDFAGTTTSPNVFIVSHGKSGEIDVSTLANNIEEGTESILDFSNYDTTTITSVPNIEVSSNVPDNANDFRDTTTDYPTTVAPKNENNNFLSIFSNVTFIPGKNGLSVDMNVKPFGNESFQIPPSPAFTVGGDPCQTPCMLDNERKTFTCRKRFSSQTQPLLNIGYCTPVSGVGHDGLPCKETCKLESDEIWKCGRNQFCTPDHLIETASQFNELSLVKTTQEPIDGIQYYPFNPVDAKEYEDTPFAQAYTVFGDPCQDACIQHLNENSTTCTKLNSQERSPCTVNSGLTHNGRICKGPCQKGTNSYFSCPTARGSNDGYCTPGFLILKANEWFFVNSIKDEESTTIQVLDPSKNKSNIPSVSFFPFNVEEAEEYKSIPFAQAYTAYGETCLNACIQEPTEKFTSCTVLETNERKPCSINSGITHTSQSCNGPCVKGGKSYFSCPTNNKEIGYCTPRFLISKAKEWNFVNNFGLEEKVSVEKINKNASEITVAPGFTVYGEPCINTCKYRGLNFASCTKKNPSPTGEWSQIGYCTEEIGVTHTGEPCQRECRKRGYEFYWCTQKNNKFGYCTPDQLIEISKNWDGLIEYKTESKTETTTDSLWKFEETNLAKTTTINPNIYSGKNQEYDKIPSAMAYTTFGEPCQDACRQRSNELMSMCTNINSNERKPCSNSSGITSKGQTCIGPCEKSGNDFFSCPTSEKNGYCTPGFLVLRANEWAYANGLKEDTTTGTDSPILLPNVSSISFYPFNLDEAKDYENVSLAPGYTAFGEPCQDACSKKDGDSTTSCTKLDSDQRGPCTISSGITHNGQTCEGTCEKKGNSFFTCDTKEGNGIGYCTPGFLVLKANEWDFANKNNKNDTKTPVPYFPFNIDDARSYNDIPSAVAYTTYGEPCQDSCRQRSNELMSMCTKMNSNERKPCSNSSGITSKGQTCIGPCEKSKNDYFTCPTSEKNGYCTPGFLVLRANEWAYANGLKEDTPTGTDSPILLPNVSTISFNPFNLDEAKDYENIPLAPAYTAFGEPCQDSCSKKGGESTTSCTKLDSNQRGPCTISSGITHNGQTCEGPCEKKGNSFFTCDTKEGNGIGYCTPGFLVLKANEWDFANKNNKNDPETPVSYFPLNIDDARSYKDIPSAMAYTAYGEPCQDDCRQRSNELSTMCTKINSKERKPCTISSGITSDGQTCKGPCEKQGNDFFTCPTSEENGYCTPEFLVLRANEWAYANGLNEDTTSSTNSPILWPNFSSISFYPFNLDEAKDYENVPLAPAYTAYGEPCQDSCSKKNGESTTSCTKLDSNQRGPCTINSGITSAGYSCQGSCKKGDNAYFSCPNEVQFENGYCTPTFLNLKSNQWSFSNDDQESITITSKIKEDESYSSTGSPIQANFSSISFHPFNYDEAKDYENIPSAPAYTAFGEPCQDTCSKKDGESTTSCTKLDSDQRGPCTISSGITHNGQTCEGPCEKKGNSFFACDTKEGNGIGYCTPGFLVLKANEWDFGNKNNKNSERPVSYFPFNIDEARSYNDIPSAMAYTAYGEPCQDVCSQKSNELSTMCTKIDSNERKPCTISSGITSDGQTCKGPCEKRGNDYFTCPTSEENGYCTPGFLILRANEWAYANGLNEDITSGTDSPISWPNFSSISFHPFNLDEAKDYENVSLAPGYTAFGEPCQDACSKKDGESTTSCTKLDSDQRGPCTISSGITHNGQTCEGACEKKGNSFFTCDTMESNGIGYCTPGFLVLKANQWDFANKNNKIDLESPVSYFPFNIDEARSYNNIPSAMAYTAYGEPCQDACRQRSNELSAMCTKMNSNERKPCTISSRITSNGQICKGPCEKRENDFFSCPTSEENGYCTPGFLVLRANEWAYANGLNENKTSGTDSPISWPNLSSISFHPFNLDEAEDYKNVPLAPGYTAFGESCQDTCSKKDGENTTSCTKLDSDQRGPCTISSGITHNGQTCEGTCEKKGNSFFTCDTKEGNGIGYCTPGFLVLKANQWDFANKNNNNNPESPVPYFPFNIDEARSYNNIPSAMAYTAYGEPCQDACRQRSNELSAMCTKMNSNERKPCTISSRITSNGQICKGPCEKRENDFFFMSNFRRKWILYSWIPCFESQ
ncbi:uncharacterized protein [Lepeophtheirus salmonis]|uniref:uncharacterized protein isoform X1 n=1 Tax=Lepeophtheirus salmonis TaxID=72036 RepID=UPI001AE12B4F|nr:uncharacterized protein LOC121121955 isoform X2 [Lepeophtheirus salmonis]